MKRRLTTLLSAAAMSLAALTGGVPASAATTTSNACGSSYRLIDTYYKANDSSDRVDLEAALYYSATTRRNCLIVNHYGAWRGHKGASAAQIRPSGYAWPACNSTGCDKGDYAYYAGPVYTPSGVDMSHRCVDFAGTTAYDTYIYKTRVHCG